MLGMSVLMGQLDSGGSQRTLEEDETKSLHFSVKMKLSAHEDSNSWLASPMDR